MTDEKDNEKNNPSSDDTNEPISDPDRRRFIKNTGMIAGGVAGGSLLGGLFTNEYLSDSKTTPDDQKVSDDFTEARMFFTRFEDFKILEQATERIYPKDENGPGAIELGVPYFIDKQLAGPWGMNGKDYRQGPFDGPYAASDQSISTRGELFIKGLRKMNELSQEQFDTAFHEAEADQQIEILEDFNADKVDIKGVSSASFFELLRMAVLEGAYSDPMYGGNQNMEGWKMKEFPGAIASYTDKIESDDFVKMDPVSLTDYQPKS